VQHFRPDAIIGAGSLLPDYEASECADIAPFWADVFGDPLSELQSKGGVYGHEETTAAIHHVWKLITAVLLRGDRFSGLSEPQRLSLIGELALAGRLNGANDGIDLVVSIPCGVDEYDEAAKNQPAALSIKKKQAIAKKLGLESIFKSSTPFVLLWSGSYNTWIDEATLFAGVEAAMEKIPGLIYLSVGGGSAGYNPRVYDQFVERVEKSKFRERFILLGWRPVDEMPQWYALADLGLNVDRFTYEGLLGSRNRVVQFLKYGVPVLSTELSEITRTLSQKKLISTFPMSDAKGFASAISRIAKKSDALRKQALRGREFVLNEYGFAYSTSAIQEWAVDPQRAPDNALALKKSGSLPCLDNYTLPFQLNLDAEALERVLARPDSGLNVKKSLKKILGR
jgi:glycosyltransferase involved in cell wall biosynthesis